MNRLWYLEFWPPLWPLWGALVFVLVAWITGGSKKKGARDWVLGAVFALFLSPAPLVGFYWIPAVVMLLMPLSNLALLANWLVAISALFEVVVVTYVVKRIGQRYW